MSIPVISIIIPVYNKEAYIDKCLTSILQQSYTQYEVIIINDGSTDKSGTLVERWMQTSNKVHLYSFINEGVSIARNRGIEVAKGEFILFVDADDWIEKDYLEKIVEKVRKFPADLYLWGITKDEDGEQKTICPKMNGLYTQPEFLRNFVTEQYKTCKGLYGYIPNKLLRRSIIRDNHISFNPRLRFWEDYDFYLSYYTYCKNIFCFPYSGYHYVADTANSSGQTIKRKDFFSLIDINRKCYHILESSHHALTKDNIETLLNTIGGLTQASFLEMKPVKRTWIIKLITEINKREDVYHIYKNYNTKYTFLRYCIYRKYILLIYIYLSVWRLYLSFRQKTK